MGKGARRSRARGSKAIVAGRCPDRYSAPEGRPLLARGVSPWERRRRSASPGGAIVTAAPAGRGLREALIQGLTPLANNGRPCGADTITPFPSIVTVQDLTDEPRNDAIHFREFRVPPPGLCDGGRRRAGSGHDPARPRAGSSAPDRDGRPGHRPPDLLPRRPKERRHLLRPL